MSWSRHRGRGGDEDWGGWPQYVPVAERRAKAQKQAEKLRKKGQSLEPVVIAGRTIAATFWGKAWCENLERYGDYENRIPRGRAYVRNGSVLDLKIGEARVDALVSGTRLYSVAIEIRRLKAEIWQGVKGACTGRIGSLLELLQGKLSREVMEIVTRPRTGLFPEPAEISFTCSCPDWASMCKHVAAVLYGVGARLDREPDLLFKLRGVEHRELIAAPGAVELAASPRIRDKMIAEEDLAGIFGIEIDTGPAALAPAMGQKAEAPRQPRRGRPPLVRKEIPLPHPESKASIPLKKSEPQPKGGRKPKPAAPMETPEPVKRKRGRPRLRPKTEAADKNAPPLPDRLKGAHMPKPPGPAEVPKTPDPAKPQRGRGSKPTVSAETSEPPKRKRGRPRSASKTGSADRVAPLPGEPKRERPKLRPDFVKAKREEAARKRRKAEEAIRPQKNSLSGRRDAASAPAPIPARRRGRPPGKQKT